MPNLLIYGASGYSARLMLENLKFDQIPGKVILAGRSKANVQPVAKKWNLEYRVFSLDDPGTIEANLADVHTVLHCAGPFSLTAPPMIRAAIKTKANYFDLSAELESYMLAEELDREAKDAGVSISPGCGFCTTVVIGLTAHVLKRITEPISIRTAIHMPGGITPGTAASAKGDQELRRLVRVAGSLVAGTEDPTKDFDFGFENGPVSTFRYGMPDLFALWRTFGLPDIASYLYIEAKEFGSNDTNSVTDGPSPEERLATRSRAIVEITAADGKVASSVLETVNGYTFTAVAAAEAVRKLLNGGANSQGGFQTVGTLFGDDYMKSFDDYNITDLV